MKKLLAVLTAVFALTIIFAGCKTEEKAPEAPAADTKTFKLEVVDKDGNQSDFTVTTELATVGEALLKEGLIEGENGSYGLYVKKVNGISADYEKDGVYWAFYVNGEYASTGVDQTAVEDGAVYAFKVEK